MSPRISVLLPCRDAAATLPAAIRSLERQSLADHEVLAVDDGSGDGTRRILERWAARDGRVRVLDGGGRGLVAALRLAADAAAAPLLARMDADDLAAPGRLERQVEALERRPELAACGTGVRLFPRRALGSGWRRYERWLNGLVAADQVRRDLLVECPIAHPTLVVRRSAYRALGGYREVGWAEDYDFVLRLHAAGMRAANLRRRLLAWRVRPGSHSVTSPRYAPEAFRRCKVHFLLQAFLPADRPVVVWGAGRVGKPLAQALRAAGRPPIALVDLDPRKLGQEIHGVPVIAPAELRNFREAYVLAAVGAPGAREEIRAALAALDLAEERDFRVCA